MSVACFLAKLGLVAASLCTGPTPYDNGDIDANQELRDQVGDAVGTTNELMVAAGEPLRLVLRSMDDHGPDQDVLSVFVVTPPGSAAMVQAGLKKIGKTLDLFRLESFVMDPKYENCRDEDDCAEFLYRGQNINELVVDTFDGLANANVARESEKCRCIVLHAEELSQYRAVFGRPWGAFILGARYAGEPPPDMTKVPDIMKEPGGLDLRWILPSILLHEVGHARHEVPLVVPNGPLAASFSEYVMQLGGGRKAEEVRADTYAADVMKRSCFVQSVSSKRKACLLGPRIHEYGGIRAYLVGEDQGGSLRQVFRPFLGLPQPPPSVANERRAYVGRCGCRRPPLRVPRHACEACQKARTTSGEEVRRRTCGDIHRRSRHIRDQDSLRFVGDR